MIDVCSVVTDPALFARRSLEELRIALADQTARRKRYVCWTVEQLMERLMQVGVIVELDTRAPARQPANCREPGG